MTAPDRTDGTRADRWRVVRLDDNGHWYVVMECRTREEAERIAEEMGARGHKQTYWAEVAGAEGPQDGGAAVG